jgi:peroxiredoxin
MQIYELAWSKAKSDSDKGRRDHVQATFDKATIRLALEGKPMEIRGVLSDGSKFDWSNYSGRYVVVCFWESWVEGWQDEVQGMQNTIEQFKDKPIDVVTINLDTPENLKSYLAGNKLEFPTVISEDPDRSGTSNPNAIRYGVDAMPFTVLVNPDGKIEKIHVFGPHLSDALKSVFTED